MSKFQVITITFNNYDELVATIDSLKNAKGDIDVLVINGGSCEKTREYLEKSKIRNISEKDRGIADAFNKGFKNSIGDYIHILNSGDLLVNQDFYVECQKLFEDDANVNFVYSNIYYQHQDLGQLLIEPNLKALKNMAYGMPFPHPGLVIKKSLLNEMEGFDLSFKIAMDYDFVMRMLDITQAGKYLKQVSVLMDGRGVSSENILNSVKENYHALRKNKKLKGINFAIITWRLMSSMMAEELSAFGFRRFKKIIHKNKLTNK